MKLKIKILHSTWLIFIYLITSNTYVLAEELLNTEWTPQWHFDAMDDSVTCSFFSNELYFKGKFTPNKMYIGVHGDNSLTFHTKKDSFDSRYINKIGIRVDQHPPVFGPKYHSTSLLQFDNDKSKTLIEQLSRAKIITVQIYFFPENTANIKKLNTGNGFNAFQFALNSVMGCRELRNNKGWVGIVFTDMGLEENYLEFIKSNSEYTGPGAIIWSVHPKKSGAQAGLENFDIVLSADGAEVNTASLQNHLLSMESGDSVELFVLRDDGFEKIILERP
ncbi:MAG: PDZ domain-containing protein [Candidatus Thiodiazotropha taylori]|nr:PDZ domain-containing protein [Candidatus Thiodiazotropha taylori]